MLFEVALDLAVGRAVAPLAGGGAVEVHARLLGLDDDGGIAGRGGNGVDKASLVQPVAPLAILRSPMRRRIAQSRQRRPDEQRQGAGLVKQRAPVGGRAHTVAERGGHGVNGGGDGVGVGVGGCSHRDSPAAVK